MPYEWVPPEIAFDLTQSDGTNITVYHTYSDDNANARMKYWYTVSYHEEEECPQLDYREVGRALETSEPGMHYGTAWYGLEDGPEKAKVIFQAALDRGLLKEWTDYLNSVK